MGKLLSLFIFSLFLLSCFGIKSKLNEALYSRVLVAEASKELPFLIRLADSPTLDAALANSSKLDGPAIVYRDLSKYAKVSQASLIAQLDLWGVSYNSYWLVNMVAVTANSSIISQLIERDDVVLLESNHEFVVPLEQPDPIQPENVGAGIEWNLVWTKVTSAWAKGNYGQDFVVANADTGVQYDHPALVNQYRGHNGNNVFNHNYNWWDAVHQTGSVCGASSRVPCDDNNHGTHTTGTAVGQNCDEANCNKIGMAPKAKWIACRNMNAGVGTPQRYIECLQFFVAPTNLDGNNPNPELAPHSVGNSYGCPASEGCAANSLLVAVQNVRRANIFMSVSAGNSGSACNTVSDPPGTYSEVFSVGATGTNTNTIATYSSRGFARSGTTITTIVKPNIVAPGSGVRSCIRNGGYASYSGTSMASPGVAGAIPIVWHAHRQLVRDIPNTEKLLQDTAVPLAAPACGGSDRQNNVYGYGALNIEAAIL